MSVLAVVIFMLCDFCLFTCNVLPGHARCACTPPTSVDGLIGSRNVPSFERASQEVSHCHCLSSKSAFGRRGQDGGSGQQMWCVRWVALVVGDVLWWHAHQVTTPASGDVLK